MRHIVWIGTKPRFERCRIERSDRRGKPIGRTKVLYCASRKYSALRDVVAMEMQRQFTKSLRKSGAKQRSKTRGESIELAHWVLREASRFKEEEEGRRAAYLKRKVNAIEQ